MEADGSDCRLLRRDSNSGSVNADDGAAAPADDQSGDESSASGDDSGRAAYSATRAHFVGLLLFSVLFYVGVIAIALSVSQYVYARYAEEAGIAGAGRSLDSSRCKGSSNATADLRRRAELAQERSARLSLLNSLATGIPSLFSVFFFSAFSDRWGRKVSMFIPWLTTLLSLLVMTLTVLLDLPLWWLVVSHFISGLGGSFATMVAATFATLADISSGKNRALYIGLAEAVLAMCFSSAELSVGIWIRARGFKEPVVAFSSAMALSIVPFLLLVPETAPGARRPGRHEPMTVRRFFAILLASFDLFTSNWLRARKLGCIVLAFLFLSISSMAFGVTPLYLLGLPFCWDAARLGYFFAASATIDQVSLVSVLALLRGRTSDSFLTLIGVGSDIARYCVFGSAWMFKPPFDDITLYASRVVGLLSRLPATMLRAMLSKSVSANEQGAAFGMIACVQVFSQLFSGSVTASIYGATVSSIPGFVFFFLAACLLLCAAAVGGYSQFNKAEQKRVQQQEMNATLVNEEVTEEEAAAAPGV